MKLLTLSILLILSSNFVEARSNKEMVRQQMNAGQRMIQQGYIRNEQIMNTQEAIRGININDRYDSRTRHQSGAR